MRFAHPSMEPVAACEKHCQQRTVEVQRVLLLQLMRQKVGCLQLLRTAQLVFGVSTCFVRSLGFD